MNLLAPLYRLADALRHRKLANTGRRGEDLAHRYLRKRGYHVVARNWRPPSGPGELDIVAWQGNILVFVEVKTRSSAAWSAPERNVDEEKTRALQRAARAYLRRCEAPHARFDVIGVTGDSIQHFEDAMVLHRDPDQSTNQKL